MASDPLFGWDLTFRTVERDIQRKSDVLMAFVHWNLTKKGFRTVGIGDETTLRENEEGSELLPRGWNESDNYVLRYVFGDTLYIVHGFLSDDCFVVNLMRAADLNVTNVTMNINTAVNETSGSIENLMPDYRDIMHNIIRDLISPVVNRATSSAQTQTNHTGGILENGTSRMPPRHVNPRPENPNLWDLPPAHLPNIGGADLNPFAPVGGGGMLFNPFQPRRDPENPGLGIPGGLPRGAVPPGARFDPFGPPGGPMPGRRLPPPDADHLPPPGFNDNMFM